MPIDFTIANVPDFARNFIAVAIQDSEVVTVVDIAVEEVVTVAETGKGSLSVVDAVVEDVSLNGSVDRTGRV